MVPLMKRLVTTRAVSKKNSSMGLGYLEASGVAFVGCWGLVGEEEKEGGEQGQVGVVGWMKIVA